MNKLRFSSAKVYKHALGYLKAKYPGWRKAVIQGLVVAVLLRIVITWKLGIDVAWENFVIDIANLIVSFLIIPLLVFLWGLLKAPIELISELQKYENSESELGIIYEVAYDDVLDCVQLKVTNDGRAIIKSFTGYLLEIQSATTNFHQSFSHELYWFFGQTQIYFGNKDLTPAEMRTYFVLQAFSADVPEDNEQSIPAYRKFRIYGSGESIANVDFPPDIYYLRIRFSGVVKEGKDDYSCEAVLTCKADFSNSVFPLLEIEKVKEQRVLANPYNAG